MAAIATRRMTGDGCMLGIFQHVKTSVGGEANIAVYAYA